jgi:hypothetical protein
LSPLIGSQRVLFFHLPPGLSNSEVLIAHAWVGGFDGIQLPVLGFYTSSSTLSMASPRPPPATKEMPHKLCDNRFYQRKVFYVPLFVLQIYFAVGNRVTTFLESLLKYSQVTCYHALVFI